MLAKRAEDSRHVTVASTSLLCKALEPQDQLLPNRVGNHGIALLNPLIVNDVRRVIRIDGRNDLLHDCAASAC